MKYVVLDFETYSACDLKKAGAWRYAEDPTTEIICIGLAFDGGEPEVIYPELYSGEGLLAFAVNDPAVIFVAHNAAFEKAVWRHVMVARYYWPDIPNGRWHDTMAVCAMKGLPLRLEKAASILRLPAKDTDGTRETLAYGRPGKDGNYRHGSEKLERIAAYCGQDVRVETDLHKTVRGPGTEERSTWLLDQTINERGVRIDRTLVAACRNIVEEASVPLAEEFRKITGLEKIGSPALLGWLKDRGVDLPNLQADTIDRALGAVEDDISNAGEDAVYNNLQELTGECRRILTIRKTLGSASVKKLAAMEACVGSDGRARGLLQYHGAATGRWAGRLLQPQNFPRESVTKDIDKLVETLRFGNAERVALNYGEPISVVSSALRHMLVAAPGHLFEVGDFSKIECVIVLALAGQQETAAQVIASGSAVYTDMATKIFKRPIRKTDLYEYTIGKNTVLGCGFQMGWRKFKNRYASTQPDEFAKAAIAEYRERFAPAVPKVWYALEKAATQTVWEGRPREAYGIEYRLEDGWLTARLPSGRKLWYYDPKPIRKAMPWSTPEEPDIRVSFEYGAWKTGQWKRVSAYGGLLTENVVQGLARDLLVHGMKNCERAGHSVVLTVHDEIICEVLEKDASDEVLHYLMCDKPAWAKSLGIPVEAECWMGERYRK